MNPSKGSLILADQLTLVSVAFLLNVVYCMVSLVILG